MQTPLQLALAAFLVGSLGCSAPTVISSATPGAPGASLRALVVGRIQVYISGTPVRFGHQRYAANGRGREWPGTTPWDEPPAGLLGEETLTMVIFRSLKNDEKFAFELDDESGRFEVLLPPGRYAIQLRCGKWLAETPARFDAPEQGRQYYVGTLRVDLFQRRSLQGWFVRFFGGTLPRGDTGFAVVDEWEWARANLGSFAEGPVGIEKRLMRLEYSP
jgi:hypothetical protein